ncbi:MAG TPA: hypothetical protein VIL26_06905 [Clostridia bacterium]
MISVVSKSFQGWENCISISNGKVEVIVTTDIGPRIVGYSINGGKNHMAVFPETAGKTGGDDYIFYGGHRLWHAPEDAVRSCQPDNYPVDYHIIDDGVILHAPIEKQTNLSKSMRITMDEDGTVYVDHRITNHGMFDVEIALWGISMFDVGGLLAVPNSNHDTGLWANRQVAIWPYCSMNDERVYWGDKFITVKQMNKKNAFKFGTSCHRGWAAYFNHNNLVVKEFPYYENATYANFECNFESYTNDRFIEIESLTPLLTIPPQEYEEYTEIWHIYDDVKEPKRDDEQDIENKLKVFTDVYEDGDCCQDDCCDEDGCCDDCGYDDFEEEDDDCCCCGHDEW